MSVLIQGKFSSFIAGPTKLVTPESLATDAETSWAQKHVISNPALKWMVSNYVQADAANSNGHLWKLDELKQKQPTITHAPMNMSHKQQYIIGHFVASEMQYPDQSAVPGPGSTDQLQGDPTVQQTPYIETLAAMYKFYFPEEAAMIDRAYADGSLWTSMECIADSLTCLTPDCSCGNDTYPWMGVSNPAYCMSVNGGGVKQFNNPHFLAGGLIFPPNRPGWNNSFVQAVSQLDKKKQEEIEQARVEISLKAPHLKPKDVDSITEALLVFSQKKKSAKELAAIAMATL